MSRRGASLHAWRVSPSGSGAIARTPGASLVRGLRRFGVLLAFLGGHLPDDERPGVHLAIELALSLLLALLFALLGCCHGFSLVVCY
jgi:hypothetical protein